jgi:hypothetical protein
VPPLSTTFAVLLPLCDRAGVAQTAVSEKTRILASVGGPSCVNLMRSPGEEIIEPVKRIMGPSARHFDPYSDSLLNNCGERRYLTEEMGLRGPLLSEV